MASGFHPDHEAEERLLAAMEATTTGSDYPDIALVRFLEEAEVCPECRADPGGAPIPT
jgi:hypothetical protein